MATHWTYDASAFDSATVGYYTGSTAGTRWFVRLLILDTNTNRQLFQDEEIDYVQTLEMNAYMVAAQLCDTLVARAGGVSRKRISDFDITYNPSFYRQLAGQLRARGMSYQVPYAGGISVADKLAQQSDTDAVQPSFVRNLDVNPAAPGPANPPINQSGSPLTQI